mgnify:CR=1 FL=1
MVFTCWNQLLAMMFGQLSNRESLRDLIVAFEAHRAKQYHLGLGRKPIAKTTFASANQNRNYRIFEDFAFYMMEQAMKNLQYKCCKWRRRLPKNILTMAKAAPQDQEILGYYRDTNDSNNICISNAQYYSFSALRNP